MNMSELRSLMRQIERRIEALKRKFARELALIKARRVVEPIAQQWDPAEPPEPFHVGARIGDAGVTSYAFANLHEYLFQVIRKGEQPNPFTMVRKLFPWAWDHRYDNFFAFDLPPVEPPPSPVQLPEWMRCLPLPALR